MTLAQQKKITVLGEPKPPSGWPPNWEFPVYSAWPPGWPQEAKPILEFTHKLVVKALSYDLATMRAQMALAVEDEFHEPTDYFDGQYLGVRLSEAGRPSRIKVGPDDPWTRCLLIPIKVQADETHGVNQGFYCEGLARLELTTWIYGWDGIETRVALKA